MKKRLLAMVLSFCMLAGVLPMTVAADTSDVYPSITLGASGISNPTVPTSNSDPWNGDYVYYGSYFQDQIDTSAKQKLKWRVLDSNSSADMSADNEDSVLLMSDKVLDQVLFNENTSDGYEWSTSNMNKWLNSKAFGGAYTAGGFMQNAFSNEEAAALQSSYGGDDESEEWLYSPKIAEDATEDVKVFLLSKAELMNTAYGFISTSSSNEKTRTIAVTDYAANKQVRTGSGYPLYWTRSNIFGLITVVYYNGLMNTSWAVNYHDTDKNCNVGIAPAFQLDQSKIVFSSAAENGKSSTLVSDFSTLPGGPDLTTKVDEWKLTVADVYDSSTNASGQRLTLDSVTRNDTSSSATITYSNATTGTNQYVSAIITDKTGSELLSYGKLASAQTDASGQMIVDLPANFFTAGYRLKIFSEQDNGNYKTDLAGELLDSGLEADTTATLLGLEMYSSTDTLMSFAPVFTSPVETYKSVVNYGVTTAKIKAAVSYPNASMTIKKGTGTPTALANSTAASVSLDVGDNVFTILVTAEDPEYTKTYTLTINRPSSYTAAYGMNLEDITLPAGFSWALPGTSVGEITADGRRFPVNYTFEGNMVTAEFLVIVEKAIPSYTAPSGLVATYGDTLSDVSLPQSWAWKLSGNTSVGNAGTNTFTAVYTPMDTEHYATVEVSIALEVEKKQPNYTVPSGLTATYGDTLGDVSLPSGFSWKLGRDTSVGSVGMNFFKVIFTPSDTTNYKTVEVNVGVDVKKASATAATPTDLTAIYGDTLADVPLPDGYAWKLSESTSVGDAGTNDFIAVYTPLDTANYSSVEMNLSIQVQKAVPQIGDTDILTATYGKTLAEVQPPEGFSWVQPLDTSVGNVGTHLFTALYTPSDTANYQSVSVSLIVEVVKAVPQVTAPTNLIAKYGDALKDVPLPEGFAWQSPENTKVGNVGTNSFAVIYTPIDTENYKTVELNAEIEVAKATPPYTAPTNLKSKPNQLLSTVSLPLSWAWKDGSESVGSASSTAKSFIAIFTAGDTENYESETEVVLYVLVESDSGGNGGSGSSYSSDRSPSPAAPKTMTIPASTNYDTKGKTIPVDVTQTSETVSLQLSDDKINDIIKEMNQDAGGADRNVIFDLSRIADAESANIPIGAVEALQEENIGITVNLPEATITINSTELKNLTGESKETDSLRIHAENVPTSSLTEEQKLAVADKNVIDINVYIGERKINTAVTVSIPYELKEGESPDDVFIWYMDDDGNLSKLNSTYDESTGHFVFSTLHQSYYLIGFDSGNVAESDAHLCDSFTDIRGHWGYAAICYVLENGVMNGMSDTTFAPDTEMSRAMMAQILWNLEDNPIAGVSSFKDVANDAWYAKSVAWASENGIAQGIDDETFAPEKSITREQMTAMLHRYCEHKELKLPAVRENVNFADSDSIAPWAADAVKAMYQAGIINGQENNRFSPKGTATRAEAAQIFMNLMGTGK